MLKRFVNGLVFGCGFGIAWFIVSVLGMYLLATYQLDNLEMDLASRVVQISSESIVGQEDIVDEAPAFNANAEFLGSHGTFSEGFTEIDGKVLAGGPGIIRGKITANGEPVAGLKLRLALNKAVMSQWGVSGSDGIYAIQVPYGKYIIGGYELDHESTQSVLAGLIEAPDCSSETGEFVVDADHPGIGLNLEYVNPVVKLTTGVAYKPDDAIALSWQKYPGAESYAVHLREKKSPNGYDFKSLFDWGGVPVTNLTTLDLAPYREKLKPGHFYTYEIQAMAADGQTISESAFTGKGYDFRIE